MYDGYTLVRIYQKNRPMTTSYPVRGVDRTLRVTSTLAITPSPGD